tara:strand:+ start:4051 stop:4821 length:771 start_codon:yes stop_codon:yes gene_type:complete
MRIKFFSDIHLEFGHGWRPPQDCAGDLLVLAGDILRFDNYTPLLDFLRGWDKPVIYVAGNHEYHHCIAMHAAETEFVAWARHRLPNLIFLQNTGVSIGGVNFFGGTMWTDFHGGCKASMDVARVKIHDFSLIRRSVREIFSPESSVELQNGFVRAFENWVAGLQSGKVVVISHHAPFADDALGTIPEGLWPAYTSANLRSLVVRYKPDLWIHGHLHNSVDFVVGSTRILSNPRGYPNGLGGGQNPKFDPYGATFIF